MTRLRSGPAVAESLDPRRPDPAYLYKICAISRRGSQLLNHRIAIPSMVSSIGGPSGLRSGLPRDSPMLQTFPSPSGSARWATWSRRERRPVLREPALDLFTSAGETRRLLLGRLGLAEVGQPPNGRGEPFRHFPVVSPGSVSCSNLVHVHMGGPSRMGGGFKFSLGGSFRPPWVNRPVEARPGCRYARACASGPPTDLPRGVSTWYLLKSTPVDLYHRALDNVKMDPGAPWTNCAPHLHPSVQRLYRYL